MGIFDKKEQENNVDTAKDAEVVAEGAKEEKSKVDAKNPGKSADNDERILELNPIITEKAHGLASTGKYVFRVARNATKKGVAREVKKQHSVDVENVNIINQTRKRRSVGRSRGYQQAYKKAIVTVKKGQHIAAFDTV